MLEKKPSMKFALPPRPEPPELKPQRLLRDMVVETYLCWKVLRHFEGEPAPRLVTLDNDSYDVESLDAKFPNTPDGGTEAQQYLEDNSYFFKRSDERMVLCLEVVKPVAIYDVTCDCDNGRATQATHVESLTFEEAMKGLQPGQTPAL